MIRDYNLNSHDRRSLKKIVKTFSEEKDSHKDFEASWFRINTYETFTLPSDDFLIEVTDSNQVFLPSEIKGLMIGRERNSGNTYDFCLAYVKPEYRKNGVMSNLTEEMIKRALLRGCSRIESVVLARNIPSLSFHKKLGWREKKDLDSIRFVKEL